ncbi:MAG: class I SAM-dependent methyltransferase [Candidatus Eisenbacteria bacterium]
MSRRRPGKWSVWQHHWLAHHKMIRALERVRGELYGDLLDVGCGSRPFAPVLAGRVRHYWGVDLPGSTAVDPDDAPDAWARAEMLPVRDGSMDVVLALAMLSYLQVPDLMLREARRVLRPGGLVAIEFLAMGPPWNAPFDFWRFTRFGAEVLLRRNGFVPVRCVPIGGLMGRVGLSATDALERLNRGPLKIVFWIPVRLVNLVLQIVFEVLDQVFADADEPISNLVVARRAE